MPAFVEPMRPTLAAKPFSDPAYLFELKLDGGERCVSCERAKRTWYRADETV
jgi:hypothetical protein